MIGLFVPTLVTLIEPMEGWTMEPREDRAVEEIRELRRRAAAESGNDPARLIERYLRLQQEQYADRLIDDAVTGGTEPDAA
jgi:hypothetical protein